MARKHTSKKGTLRANPQGDFPITKATWWEGKGGIWFAEVIATVNPIDRATPRFGTFVTIIIPKVGSGTGHVKQVDGGILSETMFLQITGTGFAPGKSQ